MKKCAKMVVWFIKKKEEVLYSKKNREKYILKYKQ